MAQPPDRKAFRPDRPSQYPAKYAKLRNVITFEVDKQSIYIPVHQLKYSDSIIQEALMQGDKKSVQAAVNTINEKAPSLDVFDVVLSAVVCGRVDAIHFASVLTVQRKYEDGLADGEEDSDTLDTVRLDLNLMKRSMRFAEETGMTGVLDLLKQEVVSEFGRAMLSVEQSDLCARNEEFFGEFLSAWTYAFTWQNPSIMVMELHEKALKDALYQSKAFRDFTHKSLAEMDEDVYDLDAEQLEIKAFNEAWFAAREQTGEYRRIRSRRQTDGPRKVQQGPGRVVGAYNADSQTQLVAVEGSDSRSSDTRAAGTKNAAAGLRILRLKVPHIDPDARDEEAPSTLQISNSKVKERTKKQAEQVNTDSSTLIAPAPAHGYEHRDRPSKKKRAAPGQELEDAVLTTSQLGAKKARTSKGLPAALPDFAPHATEEIIRKQTEASVQAPLNDLISGPVLGKSTLRNTTSTTGASAVPFEAHADAPARTPRPSLSLSLPHASLRKVPRDTTAPAAKPPSKYGDNYGGGAMPHPGDNFGFDPPEHSHRYISPYSLAVTPFPETQEQEDAIAAHVAWATFHWHSGDANDLSEGLPPGLLTASRSVANPHQYVIEGLKATGASRAAATTPPGSPALRLLNANDKGKGKAIEEQSPTPPLEAPESNNTVSAIFRPIMPRPLAARSGYYDPFIHGPLNDNLPTESESTLEYGFDPDHATNSRYSDLRPGVDFADVIAPNADAAPTATAKSGPAERTLKAPIPKANPFKSILKRSQATKEASTVPEKSDANQKAKRKASKKASAALPVEAPAAEAWDRDIPKSSDVNTIETSWSVERSRASMQSFTADVTTALDAVNQAAAATTAAAVGTSAFAQPVPAIAPAQAALARAGSSRAAPTRAASTQPTTRRAATTRAASARAAPTPAAVADVSPAQTVTSQVATTPSAPTQVATTQAATASAIPVVTAASTHANQPAPEPRRSKRQNKGQRSTKH